MKQHCLYFPGPDELNWHESVKMIYSFTLNYMRHSDEQVQFDIVKRDTINV